MNAFVAKKISEIFRYHILLNVLQLLIVGIVVAECVGDTLWLCPLDCDIYKVKTIACEVIFQFKSNLNVFKGVVIIDQEIVAAFTSFITTVKRTR